MLKLFCALFAIVAAQADLQDKVRTQIEGIQSVSKTKEDNQFYKREPFLNWLYN